MKNCKACGQKIVPDFHTDRCGFCTVKWLMSETKGHGWLDVSSVKSRVAAWSPFIRSKIAPVKERYDGGV